jgi:hypothetical protein
MLWRSDFAGGHLGAQTPDGHAHIGGGQVLTHPPRPVGKAAIGSLSPILCGLRAGNNDRPPCPRSELRPAMIAADVCVRCHGGRAPSAPVTPV